MSHQYHSARSFIPAPDFGCIARNGLILAPEFEPWLRNNRLDSVDRLFADDVGERMDKPGLAPWRQRRRVEVELNGATTSLFIKRFVHPPGNATRQARRTGTGARSLAGVEWGWMHELHALGVACPPAVALGEEFSGTREIRSVVVSAAVPGQSLEKWTARWHDIADRRREILLGVAGLISRFHSHGLVHRDLYASHIFFDPASESEKALSLIDLQRIFKPKWTRSRWVVKDLASLHFSVPAGVCSRADRLRWLRAYLGAEKLEANARKLAYRVIGKAMRIARREQRRNASQG